MKLLSVALQRQDYNLAAHVLVYGLVKAQAQYHKNPRRSKPVNLQTTGKPRPQNYHGNKRKKQAKE